MDAIKAKPGQNKWLKFIRSIGPGLLYAGAAIGVSHLVQSTRAGALYGWVPALAIVFIHLAKYPFFKAGPLYASLTGKSLIQGYFNQGKTYVALFLIFTFGTMFAIISAIVMVTAGISAYFFGWEANPDTISGLIIAGAILFLLMGRYSVLDWAMKVIILLLSLGTITAFFLAFTSETPPPAESLDLLYDGIFLSMLVKLMGWMPAPLDLSVWHSLWTIEKQNEAGEEFSVKESLRDFEFGYWGTMIMGILFLGMGALLLHGSQNEIPESGVAFSKVLIGMYTEQLGTWAFYIVGIAAVATMVSTTLTCIDAIPRSLAECWKIGMRSEQRFPYPVALVVLGTGSYLLLALWGPSMTKMVDLATIISFCSTPVIALMNYKVMRGDEISNSYRPEKWETLWEKSALIALIALVVVFLVVG